ncbi:MAG: tRNA 2-selenouridine(34) synthase MnmH [Candidatus Cloacimonetes bacterium]|nr:tRNA 2-selenouridine(34) synthase MnmH [Candidatus Cloacimonadota bacterium]
MRTESEILAQANALDYSNTPELHEIAPKSGPIFTVENLLALMGKKDFSFRIIDVRSEGEFEESHIPGAESFPILNNEERREVGILYKQHSQKAAVARALVFARPKLKDLYDLVNKENKETVLYCWRGGGRSAFCVASLLSQNIKVHRLNGGHKAYRQLVYDHLYNKPFLPLLILRGMTGVGKSRVLDILKSKTACLHLEDFAQNTASSFGRIPYIIKGSYRPVSQKGFEDLIYYHAYLNPLPVSKMGLITESESLRVGNLTLPPSLYSEMKQSPTIELSCPLEIRVQRIYEDYIGTQNQGLTLLGQCLQSLSRYVSKVQMQVWNQLYEQGKIPELLESLLVDYYDQRYSCIYQKPGIVVDTSNLDSAASEILEYCNPK